jgi:Ca2+-binding RTX toxin-like protein
MANTIIISAPLGSTGYTINAPTDSIGDYLSDAANAGLAVSLTTAATGWRFTSMGKGTDTTVWRLRNGTANNVESATLSAYGGGFSQQYFLLAGTDTFVASTFTAGSATHILGFPGFSSTKAAGGSVGDIYNPGVNDIFELRGSESNDILNGGSRADRLIGNGGDDILTGNIGADTLTGGEGSDTFLFNPDLDNDLDFIDMVNDFTPDGGDVFAFSANSSLLDVPIGARAKVGNAADAISDINNNVLNYIVVDTLDNIYNVAGALEYIRFAYATDTNELLYASGGFAFDSYAFAKTNAFDPLLLTSDNFAFVL